MKPFTFNLAKYLFSFVRKIKKQKTDTVRDLVDINSNKGCIKSIVNDDHPSKKNVFLLLCVLCSIVYSYTPIETLTDGFDIDITDGTELRQKILDGEIVKDIDYNFIMSCKTCNIYPDNCGIYNIENKLVFGIFIVNSKIIVAFKGTSSLNDFIADIDIKVIKVKKYSSIFNLKGKVHRGAHDILFKDSGYMYILEKLAEFSKRGIKELYITGHSLGGLTATIFYTFLNSMWYEQSTSSSSAVIGKFEPIVSKGNFKLVTFGSPRPGDKTFCNNIKDSESVRIVNGSDIVTKIPLPINYRHPQKEIRVGEKNNCMFLPSIEDHSINNYFHSILDCASLD